MLISSLPDQAQTTRMRLWRALKAAGPARCGDGICVFPQTDTACSVFDEQATQVIAAESTAKVMVTIWRVGNMHGMKIGGSMGLTTWAAFSGSDLAAVTDGDFIMTAGEVQPVLHALRKAGIHIAALHNLIMGVKPEFFFAHFRAKAML
ncbi:DUF1259 domain-containing protein [Rhodanobacter sp. FW106-PBR-R2A-1-13]|uniref:DUF1259 domain-containing protein n=1 Tax=Rhodanobacter sp. FW106-PBR-R2A-1-13 TaxID=3454845 RepID=UPI0034E54783